MRSFVPQSFMCLLALVLLSTDALAQDDFALLRKNYNVLAKDLFHELNSTKDTLFLKSPNPMQRVYTVGDNSGVIDYAIHATRFKVPLSHLKKGRYVFVVDRPYQKVVFQVEILKSRGAIAQTTNDIKTNTLVEVVPAMNDEVATIDKIVKVVHYNKAEHNATHKPKPYNMTSLQRDNMQSRDEAIRLAREKRELQLIEIEQKKRAYRSGNN